MPRKKNTYALEKLLRTGFFEILPKARKMLIINPQDTETTESVSVMPVARISAGNQFNILVITSILFTTFCIKIIC